MKVTFEVNVEIPGVARDVITAISLLVDDGEGVDLDDIAELLMHLHDPLIFVSDWNTSFMTDERTKCLEKVRRMLRRLGDLAEGIAIEPEVPV